MAQAPSRHREAGRRRPASALVESPLQLLCVVEAHAAGLAGNTTLVHVRDDVPALAAARAAIAELDLPPGMRLDVEGRRAALAAREPVRLVGDAFSGLFQATTLLRRPQRVVLVDDGLATLELTRLLVAPDAPLVRIGAPAAWPRRALGRATAARLRELARRGDLVLFTAMPLGGARSELEALGVQVVENTFAWLRTAAVPDAPTERTIVVGSAMVDDGLLRADAYLSWIRGLAADGPLRYLPHRRQDSQVLDAIAAMPDVVVDTPGAPVELRLTGTGPGQRIVMLPSTAAVLLTRILAPAGVDVAPQDVPESWWTDAATPELRTHLRSVLALARAVRDEAP